MTRSDFFNEILPQSFQHNNKESGPDSRRVYDNKPKDVKFIKRIAREKIRLDGAPIQYFPIDITTNNSTMGLSEDNILKDHTNLTLCAPISMNATWTPQEYQMDLSKWGVIMPSGSDQQIFIHVDDLSEYLGRKPVVGDIIETILDKTRYKVADVFFGHINLWENIFCMLTLTKTTYDNFTQQLDQYDTGINSNYKDTYTKLEEVLDIMSGETFNSSNAEIQVEKVKTDSPTKPRKKSIDVALDIMTMKL